MAPGMNIQDVIVSDGEDSGDDDIEDSSFERSLKPYDPYENELIGQFLMALGYLAAKANVDIIAVGLLQQTPRDKTYGDVLLGCGSYHAIEFKRAKGRNGFRSEERKWDPDLLKDTVQKKWMHARDRGHWMVWGSADRRSVRYAPYLRCIFHEWAVADMERAAGDLLARIIADHAGLKTGLTTHEFAGFRTAADLNAYLLDIGRHRVASASGGSGSVGMNYLGIGVHSEHGLVMFSAETLSLELERRATPHADLPLVPSPQPAPAAPSRDHRPSF